MSQVSSSTKLRLHVQTPEGEAIDLEAPAQEQVHALKERAIGQLGLRPAAGTVYFLFLGGARLADNVSLGEAGIKDGMTLILASEPQVGTTPTA